MVDLDAIRKKIAQLNGSAKGGNNVWWRPKIGEYNVRIVPWVDSGGQPFKELWYYYGIGKPNGQGKGPFPMPTLKQYGKPDPIQELINSLRKEDADKGTDENKELCKQLYPKMKAFIPVIVRGEEAEGVRLWGLTPKLYEKILGFFVDPEIIEETPDFTDMKLGRDLKVKVSDSGKKYNGRSVNDIDATPSLKKGPLSADPIQAKKWQDSIPSLADADPAPTYDEMKKRLDDYFTVGTKEASTDGAGAERENGTSTGKDLDALSKELATKPTVKAKEEAPQQKVEAPVAETVEEEKHSAKSKKKPAAKAADSENDLETMFKELEDAGKDS